MSTCGRERGKTLFIHLRATIHTRTLSFPFPRIPGQDSVDIKLVSSSALTNNEGNTGNVKPISECSLCSGGMTRLFIKMLTDWLKICLNTVISGMRKATNEKSWNSCETLNNKCMSIFNLK